MIILIFIVDTLARQYEEFYEYQIGLMITQPQEDFIIIQNQIRHKIEDQKAIKIYDKIGLIGEKNHRMDQIIDMKQNQFEQQDCIWILYKVDNKSILSKQSIDDQEFQESYYLHLDYECYTFYFISISQIVIDCQNSRSNILVSYEIKLKVQQSYYHSYYKEAILRKFLLIHSSDKFVFIQQEQFFILCRQQNIFKVCNQYTYQHDAHTAYIHQNKITLISDSCIYPFKIYGNEFDQISLNYEENVMRLEMQIKFPIYFYFQISNSEFEYYLVYSDEIKLCSERKCSSFVFDCCAIKVDFQQNFLIIQTQSNIKLLSMLDQTLVTIKRQFNNEIILVNGLLQEFYISNNSLLTYYGLSQVSYIRVTSQPNIINYYQNYFQFQSYDNTQILFDPIFKFKLQKYQHFILVGGLLNISFTIEDKYKDLIKINHDYFIKKQYLNVEYFFIHNNDLGDPYLFTIYDQQLSHYDLYKGLIHKISLEIQDFNFLKKIQSFNQAYQMQDIRNGQQYIMLYDNGKLETFQINCDQNFILIQLKKRLCICQNGNEIGFYVFQIGLKISIFKNLNERFLHYDEYNRILYLVNDTYLIIKYLEAQQLNPLHQQTIYICQNFINVVVLEFKLILVCTKQMILYNKISNFRYVISGNIELYGQKFDKESLIISNDYNLFYLIDNDTMHVFISNLPLTQIYVTVIKIDQFDDVKSQNQHICFQYKQNLTCYYYQINIKFIYDLDQVEYHQIFQVGVCGENIYSKKCKKYTTRLDQMIRKISISKPRLSLVINTNMKQIKLDNKYFSGTIEKIFVNNNLQKPKLYLEAYLSIYQQLGQKTLYFGVENSIYILRNYTLLIYNIQTKQTRNLQVQKTVINIFKYQNDLLLIGQNSILVLSCNIDCKQRIILNLTVSYHSTLFINNNLLYITGFQSLKIYDIESMINNVTYQPIEEQLEINLIDISSDLDQQSCMVYLDYRNQIFYRYKSIKIYYDISNALQSIGISLDQYQSYAIHSIKLVCNCKILFINTNFGAYFLEMQQELKFLAEIVTFNSTYFKKNTFLEGKTFLFYIKQQFDSVIIFRFTENEIYNSKYIDFFHTLDLQRAYDLKDYYFYTYNDNLYLVQPDNKEYFIQKINLDVIISLEHVTNKQKELLITLTNTDETKSFIIEFQIEESYQYLIYWIIIASLVGLYIYLIYYRTKQEK